MKLEKDKLTLFVQNPTYFIFALSYKQPILQLIYTLNTDLKLTFRLLVQNTSLSELSNFLNQIYISRGINCNENLFLFENRQDKSHVFPSYKTYKYVFIITGKNIHNKDIYMKMVAAIVEIREIQAISENELLKMREGTLKSILMNLD